MEIANARRNIAPAGWLGVVVGVVDGLSEGSASQNGFFNKCGVLRSPVIYVGCAQDTALFEK